MRKKRITEIIAHLDAGEMDGADINRAYDIINKWFSIKESSSYSNLKIITVGHWDFEFQLHGDREETDDEYNERIKKEKIQLEKKEKRKQARIERVRKEAKELGTI